MTWSRPVQRSSNAEAAVEYRAILEHSGSRRLPEVQRRLRSGLRRSAAAFGEAARVADTFRDQYRRALREVDLLHPPGHDCTATGIDASGHRLDPSSRLRFTVPMNVIGAPALTMPAGFVDGLPI
jgi:Asp-tRNA(Asn)/Glu-tRNA(Gln) amidotransferase A subunit family amidase